MKSWKTLVNDTARKRIECKQCRDSYSGCDDGSCKRTPRFESSDSINTKYYSSFKKFWQMKLWKAFQSSVKFERTPKCATTDLLHDVPKKSCLSTWPNWMNIGTSLKNEINHWNSRWKRKKSIVRHCSNYPKNAYQSILCCTTRKALTTRFFWSSVIIASSTWSAGAKTRNSETPY